jgi:hypothetical protein
MQNHFNLEIEVAHRRAEWERASAAAAQTAVALAATRARVRSTLPSRALASLRSIVASRLPTPSWNPASVTCAKTLKGGHATGT